MTRIRWWGVLVLFSACVVGLDVLTGQYVLFPITFTIPVFLGTWHLGRGPGIGFAVVLVGCRFVIATTLEAEVMPYWAAALNAGIRVLVLAGLVMLIAKVAQQQRALSERVQILEGVLPICAFCKKIRRPDGAWEQIEAYISKRSAAQFSHGFCEACGREHYGEYFSASNPQAAEPGPPADGGA